MCFWCSQTFWNAHMHIGQIFNRQIFSMNFAIKSLMTMTGIESNFTCLIFFFFSTPVSQPQCHDKGREITEILSKIPAAQNWMFQKIWLSCFVSLTIYSKITSICLCVSDAAKPFGNTKKTRNIYFSSEAVTESMKSQRFLQLTHWKWSSSCGSRCCCMLFFSFLH